ncbi:MAG: hypothetical protein FJ403_12315 [Verrucomicrobia bacterium]|nr:hypothetical protein [Verrucomicrobiota bacterium]
MDYNIPRYVKFASEFPTTVTGNVQKFRMREISAEELQRSRTIANPSTGHSEDRNVHAAEV